MANVGKTIRVLRKEKNMTQDDLAEQLYVSRQTVSNYENGKSNPDIDMLVKIAEILETDVNVLIFGIPVSPSRKKEYRSLVCSVLIFLLLIFLLWWLKPMAEKWRDKMFDLGPMFAIHVFLRPAFYLAFGWILMQVISVIWSIKRQNGRVMRIVYYAVFAAVLLYMILAVPFCIERLFVSSQLPGSADHSSIPAFLPDVWNSVLIYIGWYLPGFPLFFLPAGLILWSRPDQSK